MRYPNRLSMTLLMFTSTAFACGTVYCLGVNQSLGRLFIVCLLSNAFVMGGWGFFQGRFFGEPLPVCCTKAVATSISGALGTGVAGYAMALYLILLADILPTICDTFLKH